MNSISKPSVRGAVLALAFVLGVFAMTAPTVFAIGGDGGGDGGGGGSIGDGCCSNPTPTPPPPTPVPPPPTPTPPPPQQPSASCDSLSASPTTLAHGGGNVTLTWNTTNASSVSINQGIGSVSADGSTVVAVNSTKTFVLTATNAQGSGNCQVTVTVQPENTHPSCDSFNVTPNSFSNGTGGQVTLTWNTTNASSVSINQGIGSVSADGTRTFNVTGNTTFVLTASDTDDSVQCTANVVVNPDDRTPSCDAFSIDKSTVEKGENFTISWNTTNASSVSINQGIGSVSVDGTRTFNVTGNTTFVLTASDTDESVQCSANVVVNPDDRTPSCDAFSIDKSTVEKGENFTISWNTTNASSVSINQGIGSVSADGTLTTSTNEDRTYTLTATLGNKTVECSDSVDIKRDGGGGGGSSSPRCDLEISDKKINKGEEVKISWKNTNTSDIILKDDRGNVLVDTKKGDKYDEKRDSITVKPTRDTEYTLTASKGSKKRTCEVKVELDDDVVINKVRDQQPLVISLTEVPYTGFEAGPFMTGLFYTLLALWGLAVAYFIVIKKGDVSALALPFGKRSAPTGITFVPSVVTPVTPEVAALPEVAEAYTPVIGYSSLETTEEVAEEMPAVDTTALEAHAHASHVLLSTDAINFISAQSTDLAEQIAILDTVIAHAKAMFPTEDGWMVINKERVLSLLA